ncbi:DUF2975 domain-containing protein [Microbacterium sp. P05]|uniref:DUF2975 domain-containing protein n=1 Tax=Microbacterium sp. P05 TaxID=3366948 RepID=UPI00374561AA
MNTPAVAALKVVIALSLAGSLLVQVGMIPLIWNDLEGVPLGVRSVAVSLLVLEVVVLQVVALCVWKLLTLVSRGSVFSPDAFRYVDIIIGAVCAGSVTTAAIAVMLAPGETAPGIVGLLCGASLVIAGVALVVYVLRMLLRQAISREAEAAQLRSELEEVI